MIKFFAAAARLTLIIGTFVFPLKVLAGSCICLACAFDPKLENFRAFSESMAPTFETGDCAVMRHIDPSEEPVQRGDAIGYESQSDRKIYIFRVIAIAGDSVALRGGQVFLNGKLLPQLFLRRDETIASKDGRSTKCENKSLAGHICTRLRFRETMPSGRSYEVFDTDQTLGDDMAEIVVPESHVFVMGDHRDNAFDSRYSQAIGGPGTIPLQQVRGVFDGL